MNPTDDQSNPNFMENDSGIPSLDQQITINDNPQQSQQNEEKPQNEQKEEKMETEGEKIEPMENQKESEAKDGKTTKSYIDKILCIFSFIRPYFKVTFNDIKTRIIKSFVPINNSFFDIAVEHPDLYGPFWIYTTLIYVIAAGGALSYYFTNSVNNYFQAFVPVAGSILYFFGFGFPFVMWLCLRIFKNEMKYVSLICLYGYSLTCFIPVLILCACGFAWVQWLLLLYGIVNSTAFVMLNLWNHIRSIEEKKKYIFLGIFGAGQFILFLILKFYFFGSFKSNSNVTNTTQINSNV
jgi:hypothetical protein